MADKHLVACVALVCAAVTAMRGAMDGDGSFSLRVYAFKIVGG